MKGQSAQKLLKSFQASIGALPLCTFVRQIGTMMDSQINRVSNLVQFVEYAFVTATATATMTTTHAELNAFNGAAMFVFSLVTIHEPMGRCAIQSDIIDS